MESGKENEGESEKGEANNSSVSSAVLRKDILNLLDFIERLKNGRVQISLDMDELEKLASELTFMSACLQICYFISDGFHAEISCISYEVHDLVQSLFHQSGDDILVKLKDHVVPRLLENIKSFISSHDYSESSDTMTEDQLVELFDALLINLHHLSKYRAELIFPSMTQYELLQNLCGNLRDFHGLNVNGCIESETMEYILHQFQLLAERVGHFCFVLLNYQLDTIDVTYKHYITDDSDDMDEILDVPQVNSILAHLFVKIIPVELEVMHICFTNLKDLKSAEVERFIKQLLEASPDILREYLIHLQGHMVIVLTASTSTRNIHVMIEFLLIILTDVPKDVIHHDKLSVLLARVVAHTREVSILVCNLEEKSRRKENTNETNRATLDLLENVELLKEDLKHVYMKALDPSELCFPMSDGPLFMTLLLKNLNDLLNSNAYSVALVKGEIGLVKDDLEFIRSFFGNVEQVLHRDLWIRVLDVAYEAEHAINSILVRDHGLSQLIFLLSDTIKKIKLIKEEVAQKIPKKMDLFVVNSPNKQYEISKSSTVGQLIVGFEEETKWIIKKLTSGPAGIDVISVVGMPGLGKTTLAYKVYNDKTIVDHFDVCAWCTVDQERNVKKLLQKIYNQVIGLKERSNDDDIDDNIADKLRKQLFVKRYLIVLDDMWDTATWDELTMSFPDSKKGSRVILTSRIQEVAFQSKRHTDPLYLRLLRLEESWELLEKRIFGEESCPNELLEVGEEIARKCEGLPLVLDLISGVIARKEKKKVLWLEVLNNLHSFIFKDEKEVMKVIQLSYDHLSDHLKPCLLYLASYPKDQDIEISELKYLWSSEGLVEPTEMKSVEEELEVYLDELISSSLVIVFNKRVGSDPRCQIHDLVHDFCSIKARKEKLFDFVSSNAPSSSSSSSDLIPRKVTTRFDENAVLFNPEKRSPLVKHLLSLKVSDGKLNHLSYNCHLRHLRLLKRLELCPLSSTDYLLNEIGMLVHLRCLDIQINVKALPLSFSNLLNLETLVVKNGGLNMVLSPSIWSLAKLRHVDIFTCSVFDSNVDEPIELEEDSKLENLRTLELLKLTYSKYTQYIFKRFPNLRSLRMYIAEPRDCSAEQICFPRLDVLNELEEVNISFGELTHPHQFDINFPSSLEKLNLFKFNLTSDSLSVIARLPNLQNLRIEKAIIQGKEWNMEEVTFKNLKFLTLRNMFFSEWLVNGEESFPELEELRIEWLCKLMEIPDSFGDIASLKSISLHYSPQLEESARKIKEYVAEMTGEDKLELIIKQIPI